MQQQPQWVSINNRAPRHNNSILVAVGRYIISVGGHPQNIDIFEANVNRQNNPRRIAFIPGSDALNVIQFSACAYHENKIIIFGGRDNHNNIFEEVFVITLQENEQGIFAKCRRQTTTNNNCRRYGHTAHIFGNTMYVIGGIAGHRDNANQVWSLKLDPYYEWETHNFIPNNRLNMPVWVHGHKSVLKDGKIYVHSKNEEDALQYVHQQVYMLDLEANQAWTKVNVPALYYQIEPLNFNEMLEIGGRLYFFERDPPTQETYSEVIHSYDIANRRWLGRVKLPPIQNVQAPFGFSLITTGNRFILWGLNQNIYEVSSTNLPLNPPHPTEAEYNEQINDITAQKNALIAQIATIDRELPARIRRIDETEAENRRLARELPTRTNRDTEARQEVADVQQLLNTDQLRNRNFQNDRNARVPLTPTEEAQLGNLQRERDGLVQGVNAGPARSRQLEREARNLQERLEEVRGRVRTAETDMTIIYRDIDGETRRLATIQGRVGIVQEWIREQGLMVNRSERAKLRIQSELTTKREDSNILKEYNRNLKKNRTYLSVALGLFAVLFISLLP